MKRILGLVLVLALAGCGKIQADNVDIGYGRSMYEGEGRIKQQTVQSLVEEYNGLDLTHMTSEQINFDKAITLTFIHNDQISGTLVIDENGIFEIGDGKGNYQTDPDNSLYKKAREVFRKVEKQDVPS